MESQTYIASVNRGISDADLELLKEAKARQRRRQAAQDRQKAKQESLSKRQTVLPSGEQRYSVILADPPWRYESSITEERRIENHYPTMDADEIKNLDVPSLCHEDAVLYLWATAPKLPLGVEVMEAWGFTYKSCAVWVKDKIGMGFWFRGQHELLLVGTRGKMSPPTADMRRSSLFEAPRTAHSAKPEIVMDYLDAIYPDNAKIELFCRTPRIGWDAWGNEL